MSDSPNASPRGLDRPGEWETFRYVRNFLGVLFLTFGVISLILLGYDIHTRGVSERAAPLLDGQPSSEQMKEAFELLESPHLFSGWRVPESILPEEDPVLGALDEEKLAQAAVGLEGEPRPTAASTAPGKCKGALPCVISGLGRPPRKDAKRLPQAYKVYRYLMLRRAMARGATLNAADQRFFRWNRTLWIRAFRRQIMDGTGKPSASDAILLRDLRESLAGSSQNGLVFSYYGLVATLIFGATLAAWIRLRKPELPEAIVDES